MLACIAAIISQSLKGDTAFIERMDFNTKTMQCIVILFAMQH